MQSSELVSIVFKTIGFINDFIGPLHEPWALKLRVRVPVVRKGACTNGRRGPGRGRRGLHGTAGPWGYY